MCADARSDCVQNSDSPAEAGVQNPAEDWSGRRDSNLVCSLGSCIRGLLVPIARVSRTWPPFAINLGGVR